MIEPKKQDFTLYQGADWEHTFVVLVENTTTPVDISGCTAKLQARVEGPEDPLAVIDIAGLIGGANGQVQFKITAAMTVGEVWEKAGYDAELYWPGPSGKIDKLGLGKFKLVREYTTV